MPPKKRSRIPSNLSRQINSEKVVTRNLLNGFVSNGSRGESLVEEIMGRSIKNISLNGLIQIAGIISKLINVKFERNYKRRKALIIKWFQDNEELIAPIKSNVKIVYENEITADDQDTDEKNIQHSK